jgi:hypothetical protein
MYVILTRLKLAEDVLQLQDELAELCGPNLMEIASLVMDNRETLAVEFMVCIFLKLYKSGKKNYCMCILIHPDHCLKLNAIRNTNP